FLLLPLYTRALTQGQLGTVDLIVQMANLMIPVVTVSVAEAVNRFGLDSSHKKNVIFSTSVIITLIGLLFFIFVIPFISKIKFVNSYGWMLYVYVLTASLKMVFSEFVRSRKLVKLYAFNGIITTASMLLFNVLFLVVFKIGIIGYLLAIILSDLLSIIFLSVIAELHRYFSFKWFSKSTAKKMLRFSIPLIPTAMMWWVTNVSDRFLVAYALGEASNGLYTVSYKIPTIIATVYTMFNQAWNMSAITEHGSKNRNRFYSNVFDSNSSAVYIVAAGVLLFIIPLTKLLVAPSYYISYTYAPYLVLATVFTCFSAFLSSVYTATKKTARSFVTSLLGAVLNIELNFLLIPKFGINGAAFATFVSYFAVFITRLIDTRKLIRFHFIPGKIFINTLILTLMALTVMKLSGWLLVSALISGFLLVVLLNMGILFKAMRTVLPPKILNLIPFLKTKG
ncbi:MAG: polysaccharide biosynthesis C-terminal domain-containing protein, partial [Oscillospiraceae bacterium]